jgi:DNA primase
VEGVLDALLAKAEGIRNVVSLNGSGLNDEQITALADAGIKRIILCLDNDATGQDNTYRITKRILEHDAQMMVYITQLPDGMKDVDDLITQQGRDAFYDEVHYSIGMGEYLALQLIKQFPKRDETRPLPAMQRDRLLREMHVILEQLNSYQFEADDLKRELENFYK